MLRWKVLLDRRDKRSEDAKKIVAQVVVAELKGGQEQHLHRGRIGVERSGKRFRM
jgi:hypothetical protein